MLTTEEFYWEGEWTSVEGDTLLEVFNELELMNYDDDDLEVFDKNGKLVGYAGENGWRKV